MSTTSIVDLSARIAANAAAFNNDLVSHNLPSPYFDENAPLPGLIPSDALVEVQAARMAMIQDTAELRHLMLGCTQREYIMSFSSNENLSLQATVRFGLAKYPGSEEPNRTGFCLANNTDLPMYDFFSTVPERARRFANAMTAFSERGAGLVSHVTDNYPWGELGSGKVVDVSNRQDSMIQTPTNTTSTPTYVELAGGRSVGGSKGFVSHALARKFPSLKLIVQDLAPVIEKAKAEAPADLADRVTYMAYDFLADLQPVHGADLYFFRSIFPKWPTKYCVQILRNHIRALKPGARIVVMDAVLPEKGNFAGGKAEEGRLRGLDMTMLELFNAHEREMNDWRCLFGEADGRFVFKGGWLPDGSNKWIFVAEWRGEV